MATAWVAPNAKGGEMAIAWIGAVGIGEGDKGLLTPGFFGLCAGPAGEMLRESPRNDGKAAPLIKARGPCSPGSPAAPEQ